MEINLTQPKIRQIAHTLEFFVSNFQCFGPYLKAECMNLKAKPHKQSLVVEDQSDMGFESVPPCLGGVRLQ